MGSWRFEVTCGEAGGHMTVAGVKTWRWQTPWHVCVLLQNVSRSAAFPEVPQRDEREKLCQTDGGERDSSETSFTPRTPADESWCRSKKGFRFIKNLCHLKFMRFKLAKNKNWSTWIYQSSNKWYLFFCHSKVFAFTAFDSDPTFSLWASKTWPGNFCSVCPAKVQIVRISLVYSPLLVTPHIVRLIMLLFVVLFAPNEAILLLTGMYLTTLFNIKKIQSYAWKLCLKTHSRFEKRKPQSMILPLSCVTLCTVLFLCQFICAIPAQ